MKQKITFLFLALFTGLLSSQTVSIQGGSSYGTIQEAIDASTDGDVILITGTHTESISFTKGITLRGTNPLTDIIRANALPSTASTRVISMGGSASNINITIENLGIKNGNISGAGNNGGGINIDKITGLVTLKNLIIEDNKTTINGGAIGVAGSNVDIIECTIKNNFATQDGGAIIAATNNGAAIDNVVNIKQSLIDSNTGRNGGGIYINGNFNFGDQYKIAVNIENSTVSNNTSNVVSTGSGGGAIFSNSRVWIPDTAIGNATLNLIHATLYGNVCTNIPGRAGIQFNNAKVTNFSAYNSIIVSKEDLNEKTINFANSNVINIVNCIIGGTNVPPTIVSDPVPNANNNEVGKTASYAGLTGTLTSDGGSTQVIPITGGKAENYCTVATGVTIPTIDQRGYSRTVVGAGAFNDAGAYEIGATTLSIGDKIAKNSSVKIFPNPTKGYVKISGVNTVNSVRIYSILGSLEKVIHNQSEFNVSNLSRGIHMMVIESDGLKTVKRIVIE